MPSGNKPLPEPIFTQIYVAILHHWATRVKVLFISLSYEKFLILYLFDSEN